MAIIKCISSKKSLKAGLDYIENEVKTHGLVSGINCQPETALFEMQATKALHEKTEGQQYKHIVQSFPKGEVKVEKAHQLGIEFIKRNPKFDGYEVVVATHQDKDHIHNHIIINSVNFENGLKFHQSKKDLYQFREISDQLCRENGLSIAEKGKTFDGKNRNEISAYNRGTFNKLKEADQEQVKGKSWVYDIGSKVVVAKAQSKDKADFMNRLDNQGVRVRWEDNRKYITYTDKAREEQGLKATVRDKRLNQFFNMDFSKEGLENEFRQRSREIFADADRRIADHEITQHQRRANGTEQTVRDYNKRVEERKRRDEASKREAERKAQSRERGGRSR